MLHGELELDAVRLDGGDADAFRQLLDAVRQRGLVAPASTNGRADASRSLHVEGDNPIAEAVVDLLHGAGDVTRGAIDEQTIIGSDVVISCAGWLPDAAWRAVDASCERHRTAWHMCYAEGTRFFVGPLSVSGRTASYTDTRNRRLAAARAPDELLGHWRYLDEGEHLPPLAWPSSSGAVVVAGLVVSDVLAYLRGEHPPSDGDQIEIDLSRFEVRRHPVLPIPRFADASPVAVGDP